MSWDRELAEFFTDTVTISTAVTSRTVHGVETWSTPRTVQARVVRSHGVRRTDQGESFPNESVVWFRSTVLPSTSAKIEVDGHAQPVQRTESYPDEDGYYHSKVWLGWQHRGAG